MPSDLGSGDDDIRAGGDDRPNRNNKLQLIYYNITRHV